MTDNWYLYVDNELVSGPYYEDDADYMLDLYSEEMPDRRVKICRCNNNYCES